MIDGIFDDPFFFQFQPQNYVSFLDLILLPAVHQTLICTARWLLFSVDMITFLFVILGSFSLPFFLVLNLHRNALKSSSISSIFIATFRTKIVQTLHEFQNQFIYYSREFLKKFKSNFHSFFFPCASNQSWACLPMLSTVPKCKCFTTSKKGLNCKNLL